MGNAWDNLPPSVSMNDPRAPWNAEYDDAPECECGEPAGLSGLCRYCLMEERAIQKWERQREERE